MKPETGVSIIALGCAKNIVESEHIAGILHQKGLRLTTDIASADAALVHTCSFIGDARNESEKTIGALVDLKRAGKLRKVLVSGCLVQGESEKIAERFPEVDGFIGTGQLERIGDFFLEENVPRCIVGRPGGLLESPAPRLLSSPLPSAYLRLSEGCNHRCSFCVIPRLRGVYRSRTIESVAGEAAALARRGVEEIILVAQDISCYGMDNYGRLALPELVRAIAKVPGIRWVRLMYAYPRTVTAALLDVIRDEPKVCKYIDIPLQHVSERVLKDMRRPAGVRRTVERLKQHVPGLAIRTSFIVGFPGETDRDFEKLAKFVEEGWFEHAGVFEYSSSGDPAARFSRQTDARTRRQRRRELMRIQKKVVAAHHRQRIGSTVEVLVEEQLRRGWFAGRASFQAPEVDTRILFSGNVRAGEFVNVRVTGIAGYDLAGEQVPAGKRKNG